MSSVISPRNLLHGDITLVKIVLFVLQVTVDLDHFPDFKDDAAFASGMLREQSVFTIPGWVRNHKS